MTTTLPASGFGSAPYSSGTLYSPDQSDGAGREKFARDLEDLRQPTALGTSRTKVPHRAIETRPPTGKQEPSEPSATCLAVVPFVPVAQQPLPFTLEFSPVMGVEKSTSTFWAAKTTWAAETVSKEYPVLATPLAGAMAAFVDQPSTKVQSPPVDAEPLPTQVGAPAAPNSQVDVITVSPAMVQAISEELTVAVRLKAQSSQTPAATGAGAKPVLLKEPRRVDLDEVPAVQALREPAFQAAAWNSHESSGSAGPHASPEKNTVTPEHLSAAPIQAERPAKVTEPLRNLSIQLGQANQEKVELRVTERAGEVRVAVRTADVELQNGLRQSLPELVHRLEGQGYRADAWRPAGVVTAATPVGETRQSSPDFQRGDSQAQQGWSQQERGQQDHNHSQCPQWVEELEGNLAGDGKRSTGEFYGYIR